MRYQYLVKRKQQSGYILVMSAVFLFLLMAGSAHFYFRTSENTLASGTVRDSSQALLLAESVMELMRGQLVLNRLDTDNTTRVAACADANNNNATSDICEAAQIRGNMSDPSAQLFSYMYYISSGSALEHSSPSILQRIANGEAADAEASTLATQKVTEGDTQLRINDLFGGAFAPRLYKLNGNSLLVASSASTWNAETASEKAAAWIEVIVNPDNPNAVDLIVQAVAQVGKAKSYVQRYAGSFSSGTTLGSVSVLSEASNIDRSS